MQIEWHNEKRIVKDLLPADYNPRVITEKEKADLERSLRTWGMAIPVNINIGNRNNILIAGHQRILMMGMMGKLEEEVDVRVPSRELTLEEEKELNITLNRVGGKFDFDKLFENYDVETLLRSGFDNDDLSGLFDNVDIIDDLENGGGESDAKEQVVPRMQVGDVFRLGNHRVMLGDSTNEEHVRKLIGNDINDAVDMVYCDPPYNIGLDYSDGMTTDGKYGGSYTKGKDTKKDEDYINFVQKTIENAIKVSKENAHYFYWCDEKYIWVMQDIYNRTGIDNKRVCMWIKNNFNMTPQIAFNKVYEPCVYGTKGSPFLSDKFTKLNEVLNTNVETGNQVHDEIFDMFNIWLVKRENTTEYEHPTQKPLDLHSKPLKRCTKINDIVLDLFGGSGSTMMACEQMGRRARTMEIDPIFCEKILRRWERFTGLTAEKI